MNKISLISIALATLLAGCTSGVDERTAVPREANITHVCIDEHKTQLTYSSKETLQFIQNALKKKGITSEAFNKTANCPNILTHSIKGKKEIITRAKIKLTQLEGGKKRLGEVAYYRRGDERTRSLEVGAEGQLESMINELFKHY